LQERSGRVLWIVLVFLIAMGTLDFNLFDWIYWLPGIEKMPWQN
jgi:hypothetical protein